MNGLVSAQKLAKLLRVHRATIGRWKLPLIVKGKRYYHRREDVDLFLSQAARHFAKPPTLSQLESGELQLLTTREVLALSPKFTHPLLVIKRAHYGAFSWLRLSRHTARHSKAAVEAYLQPQDTVALADIPQLTGIAPRTFARIANRTDSIRLLVDPLDRRDRLIPREDVITFLDGLLPDWIDPEDWIADALLPQSRLLNIQEAAQYTYTTKNVIKSLLDNKRLSFIWAPGRRRRYISSLSLDAYIEQRPITTEQVAKTFSCTADTVQRWRRKGQLICPLHSHENVDDLYYTCFMAILDRLVSPGVGAAKFFNIRQRSQNTLVPIRQAALFRNMPQQEMARLAAQGTLRGIRTPAGSWLFSRNAPGMPSS